MLYGTRHFLVINGAFSPDGGPKANYTTNLNMCETSNKGFELALNTRNIITKNFIWIQV